LIDQYYSSKGERVGVEAGGNIVSVVKVWRQKIHSIYQSQLLPEG
jgi:hypothetical protein